MATDDITSKMFLLRRFNTFLNQSFHVTKLLKTHKYNDTIAKKELHKIPVINWAFLQNFLLNLFEDKPTRG